MRWVVFDDETAEVVVSQWRRGAAEISHEHPVDAALEAGGSSVVVLPSRVPGQMLVARFKTRTAEPIVAAPVKVQTSSFPSTILASLSPAAPAPAPARAPWWRKFVA